MEGSRGLSDVGQSRGNPIDVLLATPTFWGVVRDTREAWLDPAQTHHNIPDDRDAGGSLNVVGEAEVGWWENKHALET